MRILTSALSSAINDLLSVGFGQLGNYINREIEQGRAEDAFKYLDLVANDFINRDQYSRNISEPLMQGRGILPGLESLTGNQVTASIPVDPNSGGAQAAIDWGRNSMVDPYAASKIVQNPYAGNMLYQMTLQRQQNDPYLLNQEAERAMQKKAFDIRAEVIGKRGEQNLIGTDELGNLIYGRTELPRPEALKRLGEREGAVTTGRMSAQEPFKVNAFNRSVQLKQTPGARAIGAGDNGPTGGPVSTVTVGEIGRFEKMLGNNSAYSFEDKSTGKRYLNSRGNDALNRAADILSMQKKKNPLLAIKRAIDQEKADFNALPVEERMQRMGRPRLGIGGQVQPEPGRLPREEKERRQRESTMPMPQNSFEYQRSIAPRQAQPPAPQATEAPALTAQPQGQTLTPSQVNTIDAQVRNADPITKEQYRQKLRERGIDPSMIPSLR